MTTTLSAHGGGAQPARIDSSGKVTGGAAMRVYGFASEAEALAAGFVCEGGPAMSVAIITDAQITSGAWKLDGDPFATVIYTAPDNLPTEGGFAVPVYPVNGWGSAPAPSGGLPDVASATLLLDLEADTLALGNGDPVATWTDQSSAGHNFTQGNTDNQPKYDTGAVHFTGFGAGSDPVTYLTCPIFANGLLNLAIFAVSKFDFAISDDSGIISNWDANQVGWEMNHVFGVGESGGVNTARLFVNSATESLAMSKDMFSDNVYVVVEGEVDSASSGHVFVNGDNIGESVSGAVIADTTSASSVVVLGANNYFLPSDGFSGWLKSVLMYQITDPINWPTDRAAITAWLAARYGVTLP